ncbi:uncharacterized protein LOC108160814 [Drosophila miranda]|uniref:uncharacterized protein LOC108160814 n=1 Tax=Drosophila miranda TaxID=7229 RepID=UPI0007E81B39|nr:uncharacterized protein LOC108160814 [Drosophila miranda]XP_017150528.1 uncharacterized protein LOC108160814 [Drosophila miranda]XP_033248188.1 uncharacterized protein LOC108160814 [Drosophila miranda]
MSTRQAILWRVYVYANSLYSLPPRQTRSFRKWSPRVLRKDPCAIHRIMEWAIRDTAVVCRSKAEMVKAFEALYGMLSHVSMQSAEFENTLLTFFGPKTNQFIHELINFARSPYDHLISYDLNVKYRAVHDVPDDGNDVEMPCTSAEALKKEQAREVLHSLVEFATRMNNDDCPSFDAALNIEEEDCFTIDALGVSRAQRSSPALISLSQAVPAGYAQMPGRQQLSPTQEEQHSYPALQEALSRSVFDVGGNRQRMRLQRWLPASLPSGTLPNWMTVRAHLDARRTLANSASSTGSIRRRRRRALNRDAAWDNFAVPRTRRD